MSATSQGWAIGLPIVGVGILGLVLSDEAQWAQAIAAVALVAFAFLLTRGHVKEDQAEAEAGARLAADRGVAARGELTSWLAGNWRYLLIGAAIVAGFIIGSNK